MDRTLTKTDVKGTCQRCKAKNITLFAVNMKHNYSEADKYICDRCCLKSKLKTDIPIYVLTKDFKTGLCPPLTFGPNRRKATDYQRLFKVDIEKGILCLLQIG